MSESEDIATPRMSPRRAGRRPGPRRGGSAAARFVRDVLDAVADGDDETARSLVADLHPADIADLIELARATSAAT